MAPAPPTEEDLPPVALEVACQASIADWQVHLEQLFHNARDRFGDVVWELISEEDALPSEEVWGHKAIIYARAPPTFQARYFSFRPAPVASPSPYGPSPIPAQSAVSLGMSMSIEAPSPARSPSPNPLRIMSPTPSGQGTGGVLRLTTTIASSLFSQELEYLYTGKSFGDAFEFLFDSSEKRDDSDSERHRIDKLRKDLVFMWRSRLYSDVRIQLEGNFSSSLSTQDDPTATPVFSSHRFILVSRSPYFRNLLLGKSFALPTPPPGQPITLTLPCPPFTPASLHFTLGFIYTGTLAFSHRTFDLDTAFHIMRSASYLSIVSLYAEIEARIIEEMCHGLFMAYTPFAEYEQQSGGKWGSVGCKCRQCARRIPRVLEFAGLPDVQNERLLNGARRALVGLYGDGWCTPEFAALPAKTRESLLKGVNKRTVPMNVFPLLFAAHRALARLSDGKDKDRDLSVVKDMVLAARNRVDAVLCEEAETCFEQPEWLRVMEADGGRFEDGEKVEWVMDALKRGLTTKNAGMVYQTLVSSILLRPHPENPNDTMLSHTSGIRQQVEETRMDIVKWLRNRYLNCQQDGAFDELEGWALKEISHELEVPVEELIRPAPPVSKTPTRGKPEGDGDTATMSSVRASTVSRSRTVSRAESLADDAASTSNASLVVPGAELRNSVVSSAASTRSGVSVRSTATSPRTRVPIATRRPTTLSTAQGNASTAGPAPRTPSRASTATTASRTLRTPSQPVPRTPSLAASQRQRTVSATSQSSVASSTTSPTTTRVKPAAPSTVSSRRSVVSTTSTVERPKSLAPSVASTIRKASPSGPAPRPTSTASTRSRKSDVRPISTASSRSEATSTFKTAPDSRRSSIASTASNVTAGRKRTTSNTSAASTSTKKLPPVPKRPPSSVASARPVSSASVRSNVSAVSVTNRKAVGKAAAEKAAQKRDSIGKPPVPPVPKSTVPRITTTASPSDKKGKGKAKEPSNQELLSTPTSSTSTTSTSEGSALKAVSARSSLKKSSSDTLTGSVTTTSISTKSTSTATPATPRADNVLPQEPGPPSPRAPFILGATLNVGIPCIISSKRARFRAYARYIGELEGEAGPWVGVEVPVGETWGPDKLEGREWNDGSWGGRRYFEMTNPMEWEEEERRRRRKEGSGGLNRDRTLKREGEQLTVDRAKRIRSASPAISDASVAESRGLFVRPKDVIYVLDAVPDL